MSSPSALTLWYLKFWNKALTDKYMDQTILRDFMEVSFGRLSSSPRMRKALPWMRSHKRTANISSIVLDCLPLRKLTPFIVNLGFFFDRMIEYSTALRWTPIKNEEVLLDIGPYYSPFPSYLASHSYAIALDVNRDAMIFQKRASKAMGKDVSERLECIVADAAKCPFRDNVFDKIFVISTIEHIENDNLVAKESGRVLKKKGFCVLSFPFSKLAKKPQLRPYFSRFYTSEMIQDRIVAPSNLSLEELFPFIKDFLSKFYTALPEGWLIFKDLIIGVTIFKLEKALLSGKKEGTLALVKLRKRF